MKKSSLPANFLISLQTGSVKIECNGEPTCNFTATKDTRIIDILDIPINITKKAGFIKQLSQAKRLAKKLTEQNTTLDVRFKGDLVLRLGKRANPKLARIITLSKDIEIADLKRLKELGSAF